MAPALVIYLLTVHAAGRRPGAPAAAPAAARQRATARQRRGGRKRPSEEARRRSSIPSPASAAAWASRAATAPRSCAGRSSGAPRATRRGARGWRSSASRACVTHIELLTWPGEMGEDEARAAGFEPRVLGSFDGRRSYIMCELERTRRRRAASHCDDFVLTTPPTPSRRRATCWPPASTSILFAGGDGTARNICNAVGDRVPVIGVPAGVKIHSAVYATTAGRRRRRRRDVPPRAAGGRAPARERGHGHRRGGLSRRPRLRPPLRLPARALRPRPHAERQGGRRGRRGARAQRRRRPT